MVKFLQCSLTPIKRKFITEGKEKMSSVEIFRILFQSQFYCRFEDDLSEVGIK